MTEILAACGQDVLDQTEAYDFVVCAMKNVPEMANPSLAKLIRPAVTIGTSVIVLIQNGLGIQDDIMGAFPSNAVLSGISLCGSTETSPGTIRQDAPDELLIGPFPAPSCPERPRYEDEASAAARDFIARYGAAGKTRCYFDENVPLSRWRKLVYNATINPVCAITGLDAGEMRRCPGPVDELVKPAMREILAIAKAHGHFIPDQVVDEMIESDPIELHIRPSMLVDKQKVGDPADTIEPSTMDYISDYGMALEPISRGGKSSWGANPRRGHKRG